MAHRLVGTGEVTGLASVPDVIAAWHRFRIVAGISMTAIGLFYGFVWQWEAAVVVAGLGALVAADAWFRLATGRPDALAPVLFDITVVGISMIVVQLKIVGVAAPLVYMLVLAGLLLPLHQAWWVMAYSLAWSMAAIVGFDLVHRPVEASTDVVAMIAYIAFSLLTVGLAVVVSIALERSAKARKQLLAAISHEIRTPLTSILGWSRLLGESGTLGDEERKQALAMIDTEAEEVAHVVDDLITAVQLDTGSIGVHLQVVDIRAQFDAVSSSNYCEERKRIVFQGSHEKVVGDEFRVRQILRNLACNAVRHGGEKIWVDVRRDAEVCTIAISDNGDGVPDDFREQIFAPYARAGRNQGPQPAVGIGLTISRDLARLMGGDIRYQRIAGITIFEVTLPAFQPALA